MHRFICCIAVALLIAGCGKSDDSAAPAKRPVAAGAGIISGQVLISAPQPERKNIANLVIDKKPIVVLDESVLVNTNGTLRNVIVYLKDAPPGDGGGPPVVLDQQGFQYTPHVLALQVGQPLVVRNSDHHAHNIHLKCTVNAEMNFAMMDTGDNPPITFKAPEFFSIKCDVHPWMDAEVAVFDHPYFAVTGDDGSFTIKNVPPGSYQLVARHELFGELTQSVNVTDQQTTPATFSYQPPK